MANHGECDHTKVLYVNDWCFCYVLREEMDCDIPASSDLHKLQNWWCTLHLLVGVLSFSCHGWFHSRICLCDLLLIKILDLVTQTRLIGTETFCTCLFALMLERKHILCGSGWGRTWKLVPDLSGLCSVHIFSSCFCSISLLLIFCLSLIPYSLSFGFFVSFIKVYRKVHKLWVYTQ